MTRAQRTAPAPAEFGILFLYAAAARGLCAFEELARTTRRVYLRHTSF